MLQKSEIGKYRNKESIMDAKKGKTFVTPKNRSYQFDYRKEGRRYIVILIHNGKRMQVSEPDYNRADIDTLLSAMERN